VKSNEVKVVLVWIKERCSAWAQSCTQKTLLAEG